MTLIMAYTGVKKGLSYEQNSPFMLVNNLFSYFAGGTGSLTSQKILVVIRSPPIAVAAAL